jgi:hypothetical protein
MNPDEKTIRQGVLNQLEAVLRQFDQRPIALRR